jgi:hypothetical protein
MPIKSLLLDASRQLIFMTQKKAYLLSGRNEKERRKTLLFFPLEQTVSYELMGRNILLNPTKKAKWISSEI